MFACKMDILNPSHSNSGSVFSSSNNHFTPWKKSLFPQIIEKSHAYDSVVNIQISFVALTIVPKDTIAVIQAEYGTGKGEMSLASSWHLLWDIWLLLSVLWVTYFKDNIWNKWKKALLVHFLIYQFQRPPLSNSVSLL